MAFITQYFQAFLNGAGITLLISLLGVIGGFVIGLFICLGKLSTVKVLRGICTAYIEIIRDTPMLVQVMLLAYGVPQVFGMNWPQIFGFDSSFTAGLIAIIVNSSAYVAEIMRSGIQAVNKGQMEASRSLGLSYSQAMRFVIIPQAVKNILPALANEFITLVKESSIISFVGVPELMFTANTVKNSTFNSYSPYLFAAFIYFVITYTLSKLVGMLEKKMNVGR